MEGVSPYINDEPFQQFLSLLADKLPGGSRVAYDFKFTGCNDQLGHGKKTQTPFRLPCALDQVRAFHQLRRLRVERLELSSEVCGRLLPSVAVAGGPLFSEDALIQLHVESAV
jgi:hypothetical protein